VSVKRVIEGVHVVPMGMANAFLIEGDDGLTLIDAGNPGKEAAVFEAIRELGRSPNQLKHLIFIHGHADHIGSAAAIVLETGARTCTCSISLWPKVGHLVCCGKCCACCSTIPMSARSR
jgi:glyoxylase-like metal-dependent hydrolase (beta-lactamase superfamily II)